MNLFSILVQNESAQPVQSTITFLDNNYNPITMGGVVAQVTTTPEGTLEYQATANAIFVKVSAAGYSDLIVNLTSGSNIITLSTGVQGPEVPISTCRQYYTASNGTCRFSPLEWIKGNILLSLIALIIIIIIISKIKK